MKTTSNKIFQWNNGKFHSAFIVADGDLMKKLHSDVNSRRLDEVCVPITADDLAAEGIPRQPTIRFFEHSNAVEEMMQPLSGIKESYVFNILWRNQARKEVKTSGHSVLSLEDVAKRVWQPVYNEQLPRKSATLRDATITIREVEQLFGEIKDPRDVLEDEVRTLLNITGGVEQNILDARLQQIEDYFRYRQETNVAAELVNVRDAFSLKGDFKAMETLSRVVNIIDYYFQFNIHPL